MSEKSVCWKSIWNIWHVQKEKPHSKWALQWINVTHFWLHLRSTAKSELFHSSMGSHVNIRYVYVYNTTHMEIMVWKIYIIFWPENYFYDRSNFFAQYWMKIFFFVPLHLPCFVLLHFTFYILHLQSNTYAHIWAILINRREKKSRITVVASGLYATKYTIHT